jgi:hypothetical protein
MFVNFLHVSSIKQLPLTCIARNRETNVKLFSIVNKLRWEKETRYIARLSVITPVAPHNDEFASIKQTAWYIKPPVIALQ